MIQHLGNQTRVIVTHALNYCKYFDYVYLLSDGRILDEGDYQYISQTSLFQNMMRQQEKQEADRQDMIRIEDGEGSQGDILKSSELLEIESETKKGIES